MRKLLFVAFLWVIPAMAADVYTFTVPSGENVSGPAGLTLTGWGYSIHNESSSFWLVPTGLSAGTFLHATPSLLFDFPDLGPGMTATELYNPVTPSGLYQILWDASTPAGFVNSGTFALSAEWWNGDPSKSGSHLVAIAPGESQPYSASFTATPEPATAGLALLAGLIFGVAVYLRRIKNCQRARHSY